MHGQDDYKFHNGRGGYQTERGGYCHAHGEFDWDAFGGCPMCVEILEFFRLSVRAENILISLGCVTIGDVCRLSWKNIKNAPCGGIRIARDIEYRLQAVGLSLAECGEPLTDVFSDTRTGNIDDIFYREE